MKATDRTILLGLLVLALLAAFWFLLAAPKRERLSQLDDDVATLQEEVAAQDQLLATAEQAKDSFRSDYHRLVVLGKAVPSDDDAASLIDQTDTLAARSEIEFRGLVLTPDAGGAASAPTAPAAETTADPETPAAETATEVAGTTAAAPPTEASAASLPIGAVVGTAGLPVMPYDLDFRGDFFQIADFIGRLDGMVRTGTKGIGVDGRLLTVDGFALAGDKADGFPLLEATLHVTSYVAPADQGTTAGATPTAPGAVAGTPVAVTPTATTTP